MPTKPLSVGLFILFSLTIVSCKSSIPEKDKVILFNSQNQPRPYVQIINDMKRLPLDDRYSIYYYGMTNISPSPRVLVEGIVPLGKKSIPFLSDKLFSTTNYYEIEIIIYLLSKMAIYGCYDIQKNQKLMMIVISKRNDVINNNRTDSPLLNLNDFHSFGKYKNGFGGSGQKIICDDLP